MPKRKSDSVPPIPVSGLPVPEMNSEIRRKSEGLPTSLPKSASLPSVTADLMSPDADSTVGPSACQSEGTSAAPAEVTPTPDRKTRARTNIPKSTSTFFIRSDTITTHPSQSSPSVLSDITTTPLSDSSTSIISNATTTPASETDDVFTPSTVQTTSSDSELDELSAPPNPPPPRGRRYHARVAGKAKTSSAPPSGSSETRRLRSIGSVLDRKFRSGRQAESTPTRQSKKRRTAEEPLGDAPSLSLRQWQIKDSQINQNHLDIPAPSNNGQTDLSSTEDISTRLPPEFRPYHLGGASYKMDIMIFHELRRIDLGEEKEGSVYAIYLEESPGYVKIGSTGDEPGQRCKKWSYDCKRPYKDVDDPYGTPMRYPKLVEKLVHAHLGKYRRKWACQECPRQPIIKKCREHDEWFEVSHEQALASIHMWRTWMQRQQPIDWNGKIHPFWAWKLNRLLNGNLLGNPWEKWLAPSTLEYSISQIYRWCLSPDREPYVSLNSASKTKGSQKKLTKWERIYAGTTWERRCLFLIILHYIWSQGGLPAMLAVNVFLAIVLTMFMESK